MDPLQRTVFSNGSTVLPIFPISATIRSALIVKSRMMSRTTMRHYAFLEKEEREWCYNVLFK
jgi:hypothetical protein